MPRQIFYELLLKFELTTREPVELIEEILHVLNGTSEAFVPKYLNLGGGRREPISLDNSQSISTLLNSRTIHTSQGPSSSFVLFSATPGVMIRFTIGVENTFRISFPPKRPISDVVNLPLLGEFFREIVSVVNPYWGCIQNGTNCDRFYGIHEPYKSYNPAELVKAGYSLIQVNDKKIPHLIHWYNYFGPEFVKRLGGEVKLLAGPVWLAEEVKELRGIIWILQSEPFDDENPEHRMRQANVMNYLQLFEIHKMYMKG